MRLFVMDNGLVGSGDHHRNAALGILTCARQRQLAIRFLIHAKAEPDIVDELGASPVYRHTPYESNEGDWIEQLAVQRRYGRAFAADCHRGMREGLDRADIVFLPNATHKELHGLFLWLRELPRSDRPTVVANFVVPHFLNVARRRYGAAALAYAVASRRLGWLLGRDRLVLACNSDVMAQSLRRLCGRRVDLFPVAKTYPDRPVRERAAGTPVTVAFLGGMVPRPEKGFDLLPGTVEIVKALRPTTRFVLHVNPAVQSPEIARAFHRLLESENVLLLSTSLSPDEYYRVLDDADIVLMPYRPERYWALTSGIFCEAAVLGKVSVVPEGTWMADMSRAELGVGVTFPEAVPGAIAEALVAAIDDLAVLTAKAAKLSARCRREHSIDNYLDTMFRRLGRAPNGAADTTQPCTSMARDHD